MLFSILGITFHCKSLIMICSKKYYSTLQCRADSVLLIQCFVTLLLSTPCKNCLFYAVFFDILLDSNICFERRDKIVHIKCIMY